MFDPEKNELGALLRQFRYRAGRSQEEVARDSDIAHNYYGEIERGRRNPSRETLLNIAQKGLLLSLRETNLVLMSGGFVPLPQVLTSLEMARLFKIVEAYLSKMAPFPALLISQYWNILKWNNAAPGLFGLVLENIPARRRNLLRLFFEPESGLREHFVEWEEFGCYLLSLFRRHLIGLGDQNELAILVQELKKLPEFEELWAKSGPELCDHYLGRDWTLIINSENPAERLPVRLRMSVTLFEQFNTMLAVTFYPADESSFHALRLLNPSHS